MYRFEERYPRSEVPPGRVRAALEARSNLLYSEFDVFSAPLHAARREQLEAQLAATEAARRENGGVQSERSSESDDLSLQVSLVAGGGFEPPTFGL